MSKHLDRLEVAAREGTALEYRDGEWVLRAQDKPIERRPIVIYSLIECPETGTVGWCWWAPTQDGGARWGDAPTMADAMAKAEAVT